MKLTVGMCMLAALTLVVYFAPAVILADVGDSGTVMRHSHPMIPSRVLSPTDKHWIDRAAMAGTGEVILGRLAADKSLDPRVRAFGRRMVTDHTAAGGKLAGIAAYHNYKPAPGMDETHRALLTKLSALHGGAFDKAYISAAVRDHVKAVALFLEEAGRADANLQVRAFAVSTLPTIESHLAMARALLNR